MNDDGTLSEENNTAVDLITMYNNNYTITRDELPDFKSLASEIKTDAEKKSEEKSDSSKKSEETSSVSDSSKAETTKKEETSSKTE